MVADRRALSSLPLGVFLHTPALFPILRRLRHDLTHRFGFATTEEQRDVSYKSKAKLFPSSSISDQRL